MTSKLGGQGLHYAAARCGKGAPTLPLGSHATDAWPARASDLTLPPAQGPLDSRWWKQLQHAQVIDAESDSVTIGVTLAHENPQST
jgi:hypothetical protein